MQGRSGIDRVGQKYYMNTHLFTVFIYLRCIYGIFGMEITKYTVTCTYGSGQPLVQSITLLR